MKIPPVSEKRIARRHQEGGTMVRVETALVFVLVPLVVSQLVGCATAPRPATRAQLAPSGTLRVAVFTGNPVIGTKNPETGEVSGTTVTLGRALAVQAGIPAAIREYTAVSQLMDDAESGAWDIAVVAYDPARRSVIDYAPAHIAVDLTFLVAPGSAINDVAEADRPGVRIAAARGAATALLLERTLKQASLVTADNEPAAFALIRDGKVQAYAQNRYLLLGLAEKLAGSRVLEDSFAVAELAIALPKGRPAALAYVSEFVEQAKRAGVVGRAIDSAGLRGVKVAPAAQ
jgi:polar amino acid transport system substrate-binding protein